MICPLQTGDQESWSEGLRAQDRTWTSQAKRGRVQPSSTFLSYSGPSWIACHPPTLVRALCFTQATNSNAKYGDSERSNSPTPRLRSEPVKCLVLNESVR